MRWAAGREGSCASGRLEGSRFVTAKSQVQSLNPPVATVAGGLACRLRQAGPAQLSSTTSAGPGAINDLGLCWCRESSERPHTKACVRVFYVNI